MASSIGPVVTYAVNHSFSLLYQQLTFQPGLGTCLARVQGSVPSGPVGSDARANWMMFRSKAQH